MTKNPIAGRRAPSSPQRRARPPRAITSSMYHELIGARLKGMVDKVVVDEKEGRRISADMRAHLEKAVDHSEKFISIIRELLDGDAQERAADLAERKAAAVLRTWSVADAAR